GLSRKAGAKITDIISFLQTLLQSFFQIFFKSLIFNKTFFRSIFDRKTKIPKTVILVNKKWLEMWN
ncbi:hypothetical protein DDZ16_17870, partial [Marinilabilia rubra]